MPGFIFKHPYICTYIPVCVCVHLRFMICAFVCVCVCVHTQTHTLFLTPNTE